MITNSSIRRRLAGALLIAAASLPAAAQARLNLDPEPAAGSSPPANVAPARPVPRGVSGAQPGFQWADAGIGAAGTVLLLGTGALAYAAPRRRRAQRAVTG